MAPDATPKVLVSDQLSETAVQIFRDRGIAVDYEPALGKDKERLAEVIGAYDGLAVRSASKVTEKLLDRASKLRVIGRAGIGVDNIDVAAATRKGIIVMNTPFGNAITTAEHAIAMMFAVARQLPEASTSTHAGKWEKSRFLGVELFNKTLGVIGAGNVGSIVCDRALGLRMKVIAYDPFLPEERAQTLGITKVGLDDLLARSDFITLHVPLTDKTRNILSREAIALTKPGVRIINCARGGLVDETALADALRSGHVAGAGLDVFETEPAKQSPLFNLPNVVVTPHLGAATREAQENVSIQIAQQMADYLLSGAVANAINMPNLTAEEAVTMGPWVELAQHLGAFVGQLTDEPIEALNILYNGHAARLNTAALNAATLAGMMQAINPEANAVSAPVMAKERGISVSTTTQEKSGVFDAFMKLTMVSEKRERSVAGTIYSDGRPRFIQIKGIPLDAAIGHHMLYTTNRDVPNIIGTLGRMLGENGINIANFTLGRSTPNGEAVALLYLDEPIAEPVIRQLETTGLFGVVRPLQFHVD